MQEAQLQHLASCADFKAGKIRSEEISARTLVSNLIQNHIYDNESSCPSYSRTEKEVKFKVTCQTRAE